MFFYLKNTRVKVSAHIEHKFSNWKMWRKKYKLEYSDNSSQVKKYKTIFPLSKPMSVLVKNFYFWSIFTPMRNLYVLTKS